MSQKHTLTLQAGRQECTNKHTLRAAQGQIHAHVQAEETGNTPQKVKHDINFLTAKACSALKVPLIQSHLSLSATVSINQY